MFEISNYSVRDVINDSIVVDSKGQNPRRISEHLIQHLFGFDPDRQLRNQKDLDKFVHDLLNK